MHIRPFQSADLPRLKEITVEAFEPVSIDRNIESQAGSINGRDWRYRKSKHIEADVARQPDGVFVAEADGEIVGYITTVLDTESGIGLIPNLAVTSQRRGEGLGRKLIEHALDHFRSIGLKYARIETLAQNPVGQKLYPSLGFQEIARQIHFGMKLDDNA